MRLGCVSCLPWGISSPAFSSSMSPFALAWVLSQAVMDLGEGEDDKSCDIVVLTFPLWKPSRDDSLGFCPGFWRKWVCINVTSVQPPLFPSVPLSPPFTSKIIGHFWPRWAKVWSSQSSQRVWSPQVPTDSVKISGKIDFQSSLRKKVLQLGLNPR